jgi:hypothetical protein
MTPIRKNEDTGRRMGSAINPSPTLFTSVLMQPFSHGHDMNAQFSEAPNYDKKS